MKEIIIAGIFTLLGSVITFLGTYLLNRNVEREKKNRHKMKRYLLELKSFYNLEDLYLKEIEKLRQKLPDEEGSKKYNGIKNEFREQNETNGNECITITANKAEHLLLAYEDIE
ncbi:MAG: hypothetical protein ACI4LX_09105 [Treponema sp.]